VEFAGPEDAARIVALFRSGFRPEFLELLIYGCEGVSEYIRLQLAPGGPPAGSVYFVARSRSCTAGAAEFRRQSNQLFLNYIAVAPGCRGQHIGPNLFSAAIAMSGVTTGRIELDVLEENVQARHWYRRLGFATTASTEFLELAPPPCADQEPAYITGLPQAGVCHERFGFSTFHLSTQAGTFPVGRLGDTWFRLTDPAAIRNPSVFAALRLLDPRRSILGVVPAGSLPAAQKVRVLAVTHRMKADIHHVMDTLSHDCQKSGELV